MSSKVQMLIKFSQTLQGKKKIQTDVISPILQKVKLGLKEGVISLGKVPCLFLKCPFVKLPAYVRVNNTEMGSDAIHCI